MRTAIRVVSLTLAAALLVAFAVACGGEGKTTSEGPAGQAAPDQQADTSLDLVSAAPLEVLSASAESFQEEVESLQMEMEFAIDVGTFPIEAEMDMAFQAPDQMYLTMDMSGIGSFEMLVLGTDIYMNIPFQGWVVLSMDDVGLEDFVDTESFQEMFGGHSLVDYEAIIESLGGDVQDLGEETLDGSTYRHYRATVDFGDLIASFGDAFGVGEDIELDSVSGPLTLDVWVDGNTLLPYKMVVDGEFAFGSDSLVFGATMLITGYNEPVTIPGPPPDAVPFALLGGP